MEQQVHGRTSSEAPDDWSSAPPSVPRSHGSAAMYGSVTTRQGQLTASHACSRRSCSRVGSRMRGSDRSALSEAQRPITRSARESPSGVCEFHSGSTGGPRYCRYCMLNVYQIQYEYFTGSAQLDFLRTPHARVGRRVSPVSREQGVHASMAQPPGSHSCVDCAGSSRHFGRSAWRCAAVCF